MDAYGDANAPPDPQASRRGPYLVQRVLRQEPLGEALLARHELSGQRVVLRHLQLSSSLQTELRDQLLAAFQQEARALTALRDCRVAPPYDFAADGEGGAYLAFALPDGEWHALPQEGRALPAEVWLALAQEVGGAALSLTAAGIPVMRIDPLSVLIRGGREIRWLHLDFLGLAAKCRLSGALDPTKGPELPPEAASGVIMPATPVFAVATWLHRMLMEPTAGGVNPCVPPGIGHVLDRGRQPDPRLRPPTLPALLQALAAEGETTIQAAAPEVTTLIAPGDILAPAAELSLSERLANGVTWAVGLGLLGGALGWLAARMAPWR